MENQKEFNEVVNSIKDLSNQKTVFGEPIKQGEILIVPVSKVKTVGGGGKGEGSGFSENGKGSGFGLVHKSKPIGYIEIKEGKTEFVSIYDKGKLITCGLAVFGISFLGLLRYFRKRKKRK